MNAPEILQKLRTVDKETHYLLLANLFKLAFGRKLRTAEWGHLRKLINIYGSELVYWAVLGSVGIDAERKPLAYVTKVCSGMLKELIQPAPLMIQRETQLLLDEFAEYEPPDWDAILGDKNEAE